MPVEQPHALSDKTRTNAAKFTRARAYGWRSMLYGGPAAALSHHMTGGNWKVTAPLGLAAAGAGMVDKRISELANKDSKLQKAIAEHKSDSPTGLAEGMLKKRGSAEDELFPGAHRWEEMVGDNIQVQMGPSRRVGPTADEASSLLRRLFVGR